MKKQWFKNRKRIIANGKRILCDDCPCGCPSFEGRSIIYVDKHATGTGDGSSWANAYTDIQTAIDAHPKKEIQIQGHGENDYYPGGINLMDCVYLKGVDSVYVYPGNISGASSIEESIERQQKIENINIKSGGFYYISGIMSNCNIINLNYIGFSNCRGEISGCNVYGQYNLYNEGAGFYSCEADFVDCHCYNLKDNTNGFWGFKSALNCSCEYDHTGCHHGSGFTSVGIYGSVPREGYSICTNCSSIALNIDACGQSSNGFQLSSGSTCIDCYASGFVNGFRNYNTTHVGCNSENNFYCGYWSTGENTYGNCSESNNCLTGFIYCDPENPSYSCDEV